MKKILLLVLVLVVVSGCATLPVRNPQFTESRLPRQYYIEGIEPIKGDPAWTTCVDMILRFYNRPLDKGTRDRAIADVRVTSIVVGVLSGNVVGGAITTLNSASPEVYYLNALRLHAFKRYSFFDQSPNGTKIKYFLTQGHPVMVVPTPSDSYYADVVENPYVLKEIHFILLIGFDDTREIFLACDPKLGEIIEVPYRNFPMRQATEWADTSKLVRSGEIIYPEK